MKQTRVQCAGGGEAPVEKAPHKKHLVQDFTPLADSLLWALLTNYYKQMALTAWSQNYVPMFVTSNSRFARLYARTFFNFLKDFYAKVENACHPVYVLEIGAGHGRFTYLFLRHILRTQASWKSCGLPERPFVYVCTDVAEANLQFCQNHKAFQPLIQDGWLDFALFDANCTTSATSSKIHLRVSDTTLPRGPPIALVANYVLDSLLTDGIQISASSERDASQLNSLEYSRSLVAVYSPYQEKSPSHPDIIARMSLSWKWAPFEAPESLTRRPCPAPQSAAPDTPAFNSHPLHFMDPPVTEAQFYNQITNATRADVSNALMSTRRKAEETELENVLPTSGKIKLPCPGYIADDTLIQTVLRAYATTVLDEGYPLSFVLPIGAFRLFQFLYAYSDGQLVCMIGDKGYHDSSEFRGTARNPHIAIHGSLSFMVNLHSIKLFFNAMGGFFVSTPYKDTFQITLGYAFRNLASSAAFGHSIAQLVMDIEDFPPDSLVSWQRHCQEAVTKTCSGLKATSGALEQNGHIMIKTLLGLLRYSAHDPDVFYNFQSVWTAQLTAPFIGPRGESDVLRDLERVFENWYKLGENEDVPDLLAHLCMKIGRLDRAIYFFEQSLAWCPESKHSATFVNIAACHKALGQLDKVRCIVSNNYDAQEMLNLGLQHTPTFKPGLELQTQLQMHNRKINVAFIGCGRWTRTEVLPTLAKDGRVTCAAFFAFHLTTIDVVKSIFLHLRVSPGDTGSRPEFYTGASGFDQLLKNNTINACIIDVHPRLVLPLAFRLWEAGKHTLVQAPFAFSSLEADKCLQRFVELQKNRTEVLPSASTTNTVIEANSKTNNCLAWHVASPFKNEEALQMAASIIKSKSLGTPLSVIYRHVSDERLQPTGADIPTTYDDPDFLAVMLFHGLLGVKTLLEDAQLATISASLVRSTDVPDASVGQDSTTAGPRLVSWFRFVKNENTVEESSVVGNGYCCRHAGDTLLEFRIICSKGNIKLEKIAACWKLTTETVTEAREKGFTPDGLAPTLNVWFKWIHQVLTLASESGRSTRSNSNEKITLPQEEPALLDTRQTDLTQPLDKSSDIIVLDSSLVSAVSDIVTIEAILASTERGGNPMRFSTLTSDKDKC